MSVYGCIPSQVAPESVQGCSKGLKCQSKDCIKVDILDEKGGPKVQFWEPFWSDNRSNIDAKSDARIDPPQNMIYFFV